jgi:hypothetical protein
MEAIGVAHEMGCLAERIKELQGVFCHHFLL